MSEETKEPRKKWRWLAVIFLVLLTLGFLASGCGPSMSKARESANRATCKNNLKYIGLALHLYSTKHGEKFPEGETAAEVMRKLIEEGYVEEEVGFGQLPVFVCRSAKADVKAWKRLRKLTEETCSYEFVAGVHAYSNPDFIVAYDRTAHNHRFTHGRIVLFVDGHVKWMNEEPFQKVLAEQREKMKEGDNE